jgi:HK97 family phage major capsid protein
MNIDDLLDQIRALRAEVADLHTTYADRAMPAEVTAEWNDKNAEIDRMNETVAELRTRQARIDELSTSDASTEHEGQAPQVRRPRSVRGDDIYDTSTIRFGLGSDSGERDLRDRAMRSIEQSYFAGDQDAARGHVSALVDSNPEVAKLVLQTGSPTYRGAFQKVLAGQPLSDMETRAMSLTSAAGGYAVPYTLDPTVIRTSNSSVNPIRAISNVKQITTDEWRGVTAGAVTGGYHAEATESSDGSPTLAQPVISTEKADVFIPYSIEVGMDWPSLVTEIGGLIAEFKDDLEAAKFLTGTGTDEPFGVLTGATTTVTAAGTAAFAAVDLYSLEGALPQRHLARASLVTSRSLVSRIRQLDAAGAANPWITFAGASGATANPGQINANILGYPAYVSSSVVSVLTTASKIAILGNFDRYVIAERVGMTIETVQHLVGTNHRPTGQRGMYAYWRNGAKVVDANAFRVLVTG